MNKNDLELFKQALNEGLSNKFDYIVNNYTEEVECSQKHNLAMRTIVYGKVKERRKLSLKARRIIAILVAAALLLTSCGIVFRNQIREILEEFSLKITYRDDISEGKKIDEVYVLTYLPEGYSLAEEKSDALAVRRKYTNEDDEFIIFEQRVIDASDFILDSETGYSKIMKIEEYDIYYRCNDMYNCYIWNDSKYALELRIKSDIPMPNEEIASIIEGITIK